MAKITYGDEQPVDSVGKKFAGVVTDTGSANEFVAIKGVNRVTQNGKVVADMSVAVSTASGAGAADGLTTDAAITTDAPGTRSGYLRGLVSWFARLGKLDGSAFTSGSSYVWAGLGGVYQSTVTTLSAGTSGLARLTSRRAVVTAGDYDAVWSLSSMVGSGVLVGTAGDGSDADAFLAADFVSDTCPVDWVTGHAPLYIFVPVAYAGFNMAQVMITSLLSVNADITINASFANVAASAAFVTGMYSTILPTATLASGAGHLYSERAPASGVTTQTAIQSLRGPAWVRITIDPVSAPGAGKSVRIVLNRE